MKTLGFILAVLVILVLVVTIIYAALRLIVIRRGTDNAGSSVRGKSRSESVRAEADRKRIEAIMEEEEVRAAQINAVMAENVTEFTLDWSYRKAEKGLGLDGVHDETGVNWIMLLEGKDLALAVDQYIAVKNYIRENGSSYRAYGAAMWNNEITHLRIPSLEYIDQLKGIKEDVFDKCRQNNIRIVFERAENCYYDFVSECEYEVYVGSTWPGSVDDAATYGTLELVRR